MYPVWKIGRLEDWKIMPPLLAASTFLSQGLSYLACHHAQLLFGIMDEEVFMSQRQQRPKR